MPSSVSDTLRVVRCISRTPSLSSSLLMYELATAGDRFNSWPAMLMLWVVAMRTLVSGQGMGKVVVDI